MSTIPPTESPDHTYVRPGQVHPDHAPVDACMVCGQPLTEHRGAEEAPCEASYSEQAAEFDQFLDQRLAKIRADEANGLITTIEAADQRITVLVHHIETISNLRREFFGEPGA